MRDTYPIGTIFDSGVFIYIISSETECYRLMDQQHYDYNYKSRDHTILTIKQAEKKLNFPFPSWARKYIFGVKRHLVTGRLP